MAKVLRADLKRQLRDFTPVFREELDLIRPFELMLAHPDAYFRDHLPGHLTGSTWIVNPDRTHALLIHHTKLNRWLQPGGHADGDEDILGVALREATEETGLGDLRLVHPTFFDIDIHPIPASSDFPDHDHYDVRFLVEASDGEPIVINKESKAAKWFPLDKVSLATGFESSLLRMAAKCRTLA